MRRVEAVRLHDLRAVEQAALLLPGRHTFGTLAVQAFPLSDVKAFMGHADIETTMIYVHHVPRLMPPSGSLALSSQPSRCRVCGRFRNMFGTRTPRRATRKRGKTGQVQRFL